MPRQQATIASLISGEVTPALAGRTDTEEYAQFVSEIENFYVEKHGGVVRRGGTKFVHEASADKVRLVPFIFSREDSYVMEFGDYGVRLYQDGDYVADVGNISTYIGDGSTTNYQYPYHFEVENTVATAGQTVFPYTFTVGAGDAFGVLSNGVILTLTTDYTHDDVGKTITLVAPATAGNIVQIYRTDILDSDIEVYLDGELQVLDTDYTVTPINTVQNLLDQFASPAWDGDATNIGTFWGLPGDGTAISPVGSEPILRSDNVNLTKGGQVDFSIKLSDIALTPHNLTESNTSVIPLTSGEAFIEIERLTITIDDIYTQTTDASFVVEDLSGNKYSDFDWELRLNDTVLASGSEDTVFNARTVTIPAVALPTLAVNDAITLQVKAIGEQALSEPIVNGSSAPTTINTNGVVNADPWLHVTWQNDVGDTGAERLQLKDLTAPYTWFIVSASSTLSPQPVHLEFYTDAGAEVTMYDVFARNATDGWGVNFTTPPPEDSSIVIRAPGAEASATDINDPDTETILEFQSPFSSAELDQLYWAQANDVMLFCHENQAPWRLTRVSPYEWVWDQPTLWGTPWDFPATSWQADGTTVAFEFYFDAAQRSDIEVFFNGELKTEHTESYIATAGQTVFPYMFDEYTDDNLDVRQNGALLTETTDYTHDKEAKTITLVVAAALDDEIQIFTAAWHLAEGETYPVTSPGTLVFAVPPPVGTTVLITSKVNPYDTTLGYPRCVVFFQERLWFAATLGLPQTLWGSRVADFYDFAVKGNKQVLQPDDSVEYTIAAYTHESIEWLSSERVLIIGTSSTEHRLAPDEYIATDRLPKVSKMTDYGGGHQMPMYMGNMTCFIQQSGRQLRSFTQVSDSVVESYESVELTWMANHMVKNMWIKEPYYAMVPHTLGVMVREDGQLMTCMYDPSSGQMDAKDAAWSRQVTDGTFESVCVIPTDFGHQVWAAIKRTIDGVERQYIEYITDDFYMDSAMYTAIGAPETDTLTGLDHLEGKMLDILVDGAVHPQRIVVNGTIKLEWSGYDIVAGLPYTSKLVTMPYTDGNPGSTGQGKPGKWSEIWLQLINSAHPKINGRRPPVRHPSTPMGIAEDTTTGAVRAFNSGYSFDKQITIEQELPLPMQLVSIYGTFLQGTG